MIYPGVLDFKKEIPAATPTYPTAGLIDRWNFDGSLTGLNGNVWTPVGGVSWTYANSSIGVDPIDGSCVKLTGTISDATKRFTAPHTMFAAFDDTSTAFTFSLWFRLDSSITTSEILGKGTWGSSVALCQIETPVGNNFTNIRYGEDHGFQTKTGLTISMFNWHHYVITLQRTDVNTGRWHVFIDDVSIHSSAVQASLPDTDSNVFTLFVAKIGSAANSTQNAYVDQLYLYDRVLTNAEISQLYNAGVGV